MPYKNIEDRRNAYRRWYRKHWPKSKDTIVQKNRKWRNGNERYRENERLAHRRRWERRLEEGKCPECGADIDDDERLIYGNTLCAACNTVRTHRQRARKKGYSTERHF